MTAEALVQGMIEERGGDFAYREVDISRDSAAALKYKVQVTPTIVVLDPKGSQVGFFEGTPRESELEEAIDRALSS